MVLIEDTGQKIKGMDKHADKHRYFREHGIEVLRYPLPFGDYVLGTRDTLDVIRRKKKRQIEPKKIDFIGSYRVCVDSKRDMQEIVGNICGTQHGRFRDECILCQNNGVKLYVLIENEDNISCVRDVFRWQNPRMRRYNKIRYMHSIGKWANVKLPKSPPTKGETLARAMLTMEKKYGVEFKFCKPKVSGETIIGLLWEYKAPKD